MKWTSRERIVAAINHREPDRVPIDVTPLYDFYLNLKKFLSIEIDEEVKNNLSMEVIPHPEFLRKLGADIISVKLGSARNQKNVTYSNGFVQDEWGVIYRKVSQSGGGSYY